MIASPARIRSKYVTFAVLMFLAALAVSLFYAQSSITHGSGHNPSGNPNYPNAFGYDDSNPASFAGTRAEIETADPPIRESSSDAFSVVRVLNQYWPNSTNYFIETGWIKDSGGGTEVYWSYRGPAGYDATYPGINVSIGSTHSYKVANQNWYDPDFDDYWVAEFDSDTTLGLADVGYTEGTRSACGGEVSSDQNGMGVSGCLSNQLRFQTNTTWFDADNPAYFADSPYSVGDSDPTDNHWKVYGNN
ncbi:MAG: hypothetical protein ACOC5M_01345 [Chloroflexota bacterium]